MYIIKTLKNTYIMLKIEVKIKIDHSKIIS